MAIENEYTTALRNIRKEDTDIDIADIRIALCYVGKGISIGQVRSAAIANHSRFLKLNGEHLSDGRRDEVRRALGYLIRGLPVITYGLAKDPVLIPAEK